VPKQKTHTLLDFKEKFHHSSKTSRLIEELKALRDSQPDVKSVIFSQWTSMLDLVEIPLKKEGFKWTRLDGSMSEKLRADVLRTFHGNKNVSVLLLSLKAGGVGLNLVSASQLFFLDCWWNPAVEEQAIQRVHRIGQKHKVTITRFLVRDSIEEKIITLQNRKRFLASSVGVSGEALQKVTLEDLQSLLF